MIEGTVNVQLNVLASCSENQLRVRIEAALNTMCSELEKYLDNNAVNFCTDGGRFNKVGDDGGTVGDHLEAERGADGH